MKLKRAPLHVFDKRLKSISAVQRIAEDIDRLEVSSADLKKHYLHQSYIIYLVASWQIFIEYLASDCFDEIMSFRDTWPFRDKLKSDFDKARKRFNTPNTGNIDALIEAATGKKKIIDKCKWPNFSNEKVKNRLSQILSIRHEVAHKTKSVKRLSTDINWNHAKFLYNCACVLNNVLTDYIKEITGTSPFVTVEIKYKDIC